MNTVMNTSVAPPTKSEATRNAIVEVAERLFRSLGYQKTAVADIARELGMSPANIYRFFPSKAAINEAIAARILDGLETMAWSIARGPGTPADRLRRLFRALQTETMSLFFDEKKMHDMVAVGMEENWPVIDHYVRTIETAIRHIVMDGQADGSFAKSDAETTAKLVHATMIGFLHPRVIEECAADEDLPAMAAAMAEFVLRALRPDMN
jgi:AcrR family transcriptional regulator